MRKGMTGFGRASGEYGNMMLRVEMKSVNHRFLDMHIRLPEAYRHLEAEIRQLLSSRLARGKVDLWLEAKPVDNGLTSTLNENALSGWLEAISNSRASAVLGKPVWADMLSLPGVLQAQEQKNVPDAEVLALITAALQELCQVRSTEGEAIEQWILARCHALDEATRVVREKQPLLRRQLEEKLRQAVVNLQVELDAGRFEQELVYLLARNDVNEEIDRLALHVHELRRTLQQEGSVGRRIDFLLQEINRETNTLGSKSADAEISQCVVNMKVWIEQIREQVQNLE
ncbi:MAG: YicC/YloC family endoribonuclease [Cardiobacteriaceae bacterium]|nr:YicC/YloC family endoribonuclease [Cardiobacteriaceae bacterium]